MRRLHQLLGGAQVLSGADGAAVEAARPAGRGAAHRLKWLAAIVLLGPVLGTLIHEAAHLAMLWLTGSTVHLVVVLGVVQVFPALQLIENTGAGFMLRTTNPDAFSMGMVQVTGAASTFALSLAATAAWLRTRSPLLLIFVGYSLDLMSYISFPLLGVKRWVLFGAPFSEVLMGLELLGVGKGPVVLFELWYAGFMALVFLAARRPRARAA